MGRDRKIRTATATATAGSRSGAACAGAAALLLALVPALTGCAGGEDEPYVAVAAPGDAGTGSPVPPEGGVELVPLEPSQAPAADDGSGNEADGTDAAAESGSTPPAASEDPASGTGSGSGPAAESPAQGGQDGQDGSVGGDGTGSAAPGSGAGGADPGAGSGGATPGPSGPAALEVGEPKRAEAEDRWCEKVTLTFRNTGGEPVRSGTVTFGTHIIGALGVDWATVESERDLPAPIAGGAGVKKTWQVCVDAWRVPLGMHVETRDVDVVWK